MGNSANEMAREHCTRIEMKPHKLQCNFCKHTMTGITRFKEHLARKKGDVIPCRNCPPQLSEAMRKEIVNLSSNREVKARRNRHALQPSTNPSPPPSPSLNREVKARRTLHALQPSTNPNLPPPPPPQPILEVEEEEEDYDYDYDEDEDINGERFLLRIINEDIRFRLMEAEEKRKHDTSLASPSQDTGTTLVAPSQDTAGGGGSDDCYIPIIDWEM